MLLVMLAGLGFSSSSWAIDLQAAKSQGLVGEQPNGYLGSVKGKPGNDVAALIREINAARKQEYQRIAKQNNTQLDVVEKLAGKKAIEKTPAGQFVRLPSGKWVKK
jgi:uncharacterized protein YdbL (DUF1318 family)